MPKKNILRNNIITHASAALAGYLVALVAINMHQEHKFTQRQDTAVHATDDRGDATILDREIFNPNTYESVAWQYNTNQRIGEVLGKNAAKKYAIDMDAIKSGNANAKQMYGGAKDYCAEAVVRAYNEATSRLGFRGGNAVAIPFPATHCDTTQSFQKAMRNAKHLVKYFACDSVPNSITKNPSKADLAGIHAGSIICRGRHCYMYMGIGYIDKDGQTFVPDSRGRPVIASDNSKKLFRYYDWSKCTVVDVSKIVEYKLQNDAQRHIR